jgi:hypothetical protein
MVFRLIMLNMLRTRSKGLMLKSSIGAAPPPLAVADQRIAERPL